MDNKLTLINASSARQKEFKFKKKMEWILVDLRRRTDLNGRPALVKTFVADERGLLPVKLKDDLSKMLLVHPKNLRSLTDHSVTAETMLQAIQHLRLSSDAKLRKVASSVQTGQYEDAIKNAADWTHVQKP
jgi:hypothetical protein